MNRNAILFCCLAVVSSQAAAANWIYFTTAANDQRLYYDAASFHRAGDIGQVWVRWDAAADKTAKYRSSKALWKFDCAAQSSFTAAWIDYDARGVTIKSGSPLETRYNYSPVAPDTVGDGIMKIVCQ